MSAGWLCPACERRFANANQWHSCGNVDLDATLARHTAHAVAIYRAVEAVTASGGVRVHPQRTRIAFISTMTFAGVQLATRWADLSFIVAGPIDDERVRRIELYGPTSFGHTVRLMSPDDVDADVRNWLTEARRRGDQETLDPHAVVEPILGRPLEVLRVPLRSTVVSTGPRPVLGLPRYAAQAFGAHPSVRVTIRAAVHAGTVRARGDGCELVLDDVTLGQLGLGAGDPADLTLTADL